MYQYYAETSNDGKLIYRVWHTQEKPEESKLKNPNHFVLLDKAIGEAMNYVHTNNFEEAMKQAKEIAVKLS